MFGFWHMWYMGLHLTSICQWDNWHHMFACAFTGWAL